VRKLIPGLLVVAVATGFAAWAYPQLPAQVATHFDFQGQPNGWSSRFIAVILAPAMGIGMALVFTVLPHIDPKRANYAKFGSTYWTIANAVLILVSAINILALGKALGWTIDMTRIALLGVGGILILLGSLMTRIRPNWFMGIRTPWTLSSDTVWRKTHQFGGVAFVIAGACIAATALLTSSWALKGAVGVGVVASLSTVVYSYIVWRQEQGSGTKAGA
jgi:uncharacterized membrane protein